MRGGFLLVLRLGERIASMTLVVVVVVVVVVVEQQLAGRGVVVVVLAPGMEANSDHRGRAASALRGRQPSDFFLVLCVLCDYSCCLLLLLLRCHRQVGILNGTMRHPVR